MIIIIENINDIKGFSARFSNTYLTKQFNRHKKSKIQRYLYEQLNQNSTNIAKIENVKEFVKILADFFEIPISTHT